MFVTEFKYFHCRSHTKMLRSRHLKFDGLAYDTRSKNNFSRTRQCVIPLSNEKKAECFALLKDAAPLSEKVISFEKASIEYSGLKYNVHKTPR